MFTVLRSSAGAGKTHALVKHYLTHALHSNDPSSCRRVLALTFTNKAAGEMKERVMRRLGQLASVDHGDKAARDIHDHLLSALGVDAHEVQLRASTTLTWMLHHWGEVAISTIDAFTRRVVQPFARDLRLDSELRMTTEQAWYRSRAVDVLLSDAGRDERLTDLLSSACRQLLEDERSWQPQRPLLDLSQQLDMEQALDHLEQLRGLPIERFTTVESGLRTSVSAFRQRMRALGHKGLGLIKAAGLTVGDLYHKGSGPFGYFARLADFHNGFAPANSYVRRCVDEDTWTSSKDPGVQQRVRAIAPELRRIIEEVEAWRDGDLRRFTVQQAVLRDLMPTAALHLLDDQLEQLKREDGVSFFSDLTRKAAHNMQGEPADFLFERLGEKYRHILIDEFQDTSLLQWHALLPLVENVLGNGGSVLVVGDAKQAIYRWRNGEVRQFIQLPAIHAKERLARGGELEDLFGGHIDVPPPLNHNRRSGAAIVRFNNQLFGELKQTLTGDFQLVYDAHEQIPGDGPEGYVQVDVIGKEEKNDEAAEKAGGDGVKEEIERALRIVEACTADGYAHGDMAVLVRSRDQARAIAEHFEAHDVEVFSAEGLLLGGDIVVALVLDLLRYLNVNDDAAAVRAVQRMAALGHLADDDRAAREPLEVLRAWRSAHTRIQPHQPIGEQFVAIITALGLSPATDAYLMFLLDETHAFTSQHGEDAPAFLEHWERKGQERAVQRPAGDGAVQVFTVHKAKGLQFPVVIVPFTRMSSTQRNRDPLWIDPRDAAPGLPTALVRATGAMADAGVPEVEEEKHLRLLDDLDMLYVAFTRPEQRLYAFAREGGNDPFVNGLVDHVRVHGEGGTLQAGSAMTIERHAPTLPVEIMRATGGDGLHRPAIRHEAPEAWDPADPDPYRSHGERIHALMAELRTLPDLPAVLSRAIARGELTTEEAGSIGERLTSLLRSPQVAHFFAPGSTVRTEATLINADGHALRPDRIVEKDGALHVLEFKTGRPVEHHHDQVRRYMHVLGEITGSPVGGTLLYLRTGEVTKVA